MQTAHAVLPTPRPRRFEVASSGAPAEHSTDAHFTEVLNALSITFPEGERFFVESVRRFQADLQDPHLQRAVHAFVTQEALHGREHRAFNAWVHSQGQPVDELERVVRRLLRGARRLPPHAQLAVTCSLEHVTAILANLLLRSPELQERLHPGFRALWLWHAVEEIDHKAVAFDVYRHVGGGYAWRALTHVAAGPIFIVAILAFTHRLLRARGRHHDVPLRLRGLRDLFGRRGYVTRVLPAWARYLRPSFHPWQHDDRALVERWEAALAPA